MGWIVLGIVILVAVISAVSQMIKSQQEADTPQQPRRTRPRQSSGGVKTSSGDIDRFLQEIDRLRKRPAEAAEPARPKVRPTATPVRQSIPTVEPVRSRRVEPPTVAPRPGDLPVATVVPPPAPPRPAPPQAPQPTPATPTIAALGKVGATTARKGPQTPFARGLVALLANGQTMPMAVVLQEVLGPPKCKQ